MIGAILPVLGVDFGRPDPKALWASAKVAVKNRSRLGDIAALLTGSATAAAEERFEHPVTKGALVNLAAGAGPVDQPGSGLGFTLLALLGRVGVGRAIGGMQSLTNALVSQFPVPPAECSRPVRPWQRSCTRVDGSAGSVSKTAG